MEIVLILGFFGMAGLYKDLIVKCSPHRKTEVTFDGAKLNFFYGTIKYWLDNLSRLNSESDLKALRGEIERLNPKFKTSTGEGEFFPRSESVERIG